MIESAQLPKGANDIELKQFKLHNQSLVFNNLLAQATSHHLNFWGYLKDDCPSISFISVNLSIAQV
jgi:hypothetical protein